VVVVGAADLTGCMERVAATWVARKVPMACGTEHTLCTVKIARTCRAMGPDDQRTTLRRVVELSVARVARVARVTKAMAVAAAAAVAKRAAVVPAAAAAAVVVRRKGASMQRFQGCQLRPQYPGRQLLRES
jgi:hypothetical protein